ncbi:MAG: serine protease [bacterium]
MRKTWIVVAGMFLAMSGLANNLQDQVLYPQVRVRTDAAAGSGTVIWSEKAPDGYFSTYILTCHHVVEGALKFETKWDPMANRDRKQEMRGPILVEFFNYKAVPHGKPPLTAGVTAEIVAYDVRHDMALLRVRLAERPVVAKSLPTAQVTSVVVGSPVVIVGCALAHDPILTTGIVTHLGDMIDYADYWMSNAQIIFGNSGGAVFAQLGADYAFIGIPSRIAISGWSTPITHMGYFSPITRVYQFYKEQVFDFLTPGSKRTEAECERDRASRRESEEKKQILVPVEPAAASASPSS